MTRLLRSLHRWDWRTTAVAGIVAGAVIVSSIVLVRVHNRGRGPTNAVMWAIESLGEIPDSVIGAAYPPQTFHAAQERFAAAVAAGSVPVDSIRVFYQEYALRARDGVVTSEELGELGPFLGLPSPDSTSEYHSLGTGSSGR